MSFGENDPPVLILGYGNILRRDDGVGWAAVRRLKDQLPPDFASVLTLPQLLPELAESVSRADLVIFIDADFQLAPGKVKKRIIRHRKSRNKTIGHHQTPDEILRLARDLYHCSPRAILFSVGGSDFSFGCKLSSPVRVALREVVHDVANITVRFLRKQGACHA